MPGMAPQPKAATLSTIAARVAARPQSRTAARALRANGVSATRPPHNLAKPQSSRCCAKKRAQRVGFARCRRRQRAPRVPCRHLQAVTDARGLRGKEAHRTRLGTVTPHGGAHCRREGAAEEATARGARTHPRPSHTCETRTTTCVAVSAGELPRSDVSHVMRRGVRGADEPSRGVRGYRCGDSTAASSGSVSCTQVCTGVARAADRRTARIAPAVAMAVAAGAGGLLAARGELPRMLPPPCTAAARRRARCEAAAIASAMGLDEAWGGDGPWAGGYCGTELDRASKAGALHAKRKCQQICAGEQPAFLGSHWVHGYEGWGWGGERRATGLAVPMPLGFLA